MSNRLAITRVLLFDLIYIKATPSIFFLHCISREYRLTRVPCWCKRFCYTIKMCSHKFTFRFREVIQENSNYGGIVTIEVSYPKYYGEEVTVKKQFLTYLDEWN